LGIASDEITIGQAVIHLAIGRQSSAGIRFGCRC